MPELDIRKLAREIKARRSKPPEPAPVHVHNSVAADAMQLTVKELTQHVDLHPVVNLQPNIDLQPQVTVLPGEVKVQVVPGERPIVNVEAPQVHVDMTPVAQAITAGLMQMVEMLRLPERRIAFEFDKTGKPIAATARTVESE